MRLLSISFALALASYACASPLSVQEILDIETAACGKAHLFCVRGTTEERGCGEIGKVVDAVIAEIPGATFYAIDYPASGINKTTKKWNFAEYVGSEGIGIAALNLAMKTYRIRCPKTPVALLGYSQGGQVVGDVLCGRTSKGFFPETLPIAAGYVENVKAIVQLGDPANRRNVDIPWHKGNDSIKAGGIFPRPKEGLAPCLAYGDKWQSWCDKDSQGRADFFCGRGPSIRIHEAYVVNHGKEITDWVVGKLKAAIKSEDVPIDFGLEL